MKWAVEKGKAPFIPKKQADLTRQSDAKTKIEMVKQNRCKKAFIWVHENYRNDLSPFMQQLAKKAWEYAQSL